MSLEFNIPFIGCGSSEAVVFSHSHYFHDSFSWVVVMHHNQPSNDNFTTRRHSCAAIDLVCFVFLFLSQGVGYSGFL